MNPSINLTLDGDEWCALIGENLHVGVAGWGDDPIAALNALSKEINEAGTVDLNFWQEEIDRLIEKHREI